MKRFPNNKNIIDRTWSIKKITLLLLEPCAFHMLMIVDTKYDSFLRSKFYFIVIFVINECT